MRVLLTSEAATLLELKTGISQSVPRGDRATTERRGLGLPDAYVSGAVVVNRVSAGSKGITHV
jgi:hypothetical protein